MPLQPRRNFFTSRSLSQTAGTLPTSQTSPLPLRDSVPAKAELPTPLLRQLLLRQLLLRQLLLLLLLLLLRRLLLLLLLLLLGFHMNIVKIPQVAHSASQHVGLVGLGVAARYHIAESLDSTADVAATLALLVVVTMARSFPRRRIFVLVLFRVVIQRRHGLPLPGRLSISHSATLGVTRALLDNGSVHNVHERRERRVGSHFCRAASRSLFPARAIAATTAASSLRIVCISACSFTFPATAAANTVVTLTRRRAGRARLRTGSCARFRRSRMQRRLRLLLRVQLLLLSLLSRRRRLLVLVLVLVLLLRPLRLWLLQLLLLQLLRLHRRHRLLLVSRKHIRCVPGVGVVTTRRIPVRNGPSRRTIAASKSHCSAPRSDVGRGSHGVAVAVHASRRRSTRKPITRR